MPNGETQGHTNVTQTQAVIVCKCGMVLAVSGLTSLVVGAVVLTQVVTITCAACRESRVWRPGVKKAA